MLACRQFSLVRSADLICYRRQSKLVKKWADLICYRRKFRFVKKCADMICYCTDKSLEENLHAAIETVNTNKYSTFTSTTYLAYTKM